MRVWVIVLVAFVILFVAVTATGAGRHASEGPPNANNRQQPLASITDYWPIVPAILKVQVGEVTLLGTSIGPRRIGIAPGMTANLRVSPSSQQYRMMQLELAPAVYSVTLSYPSVVNPPPSPPPDPPSPSQPKQILVLPQAGGLVSLTCSGPGPCDVSN